MPRRSKTKAKNEEVVKHIAPHLSPEDYAMPGEFERFYESWRLYENAKRENASSFGACFHPALLESLERRFKIKFLEPDEQLKDKKTGELETIDEYRARRCADAHRVAGLIFARLAPKGKSKTQEFVLEDCKFEYDPDVPLTSQCLVQETKFRAAVKQLGDTKPHELIEYYLECWPEDMKAQLEMEGAEDKIAKTAGFLQWTQHADRVFEMAEKVEEGLSLQSLFMPAKTKKVEIMLLAKDKPPSAPSESGSEQQSKRSKQCFNCGATDHRIADCPKPLRERSRAQLQQDAASAKAFTKHRPDSPHRTDTRSSPYPDRERKAPEKYAASAVKRLVGEAKMKTRRRIRKRIHKFYKSLDKGARSVYPKDLKELLASDWPDSSDTDAGPDSVDGESDGSGSDDGDDYDEQ